MSLSCTHCITTSIRCDTRGLRLCSLRFWHLRPSGVLTSGSSVGSALDRVGRPPGSLVSLGDAVWRWSLGLHEELSQGLGSPAVLPRRPLGKPESLCDGTLNGRMAADGRTDGRLQAKPQAGRLADRRLPSPADRPPLSLPDCSSAAVCGPQVRTWLFLGHCDNAPSLLGRSIRPTRLVRCLRGL